MSPTCASVPRRYILPPPPQAPTPSLLLISTERIPGGEPEDTTAGSCNRSGRSFESRRRLRGLCGDCAEGAVDGRRSAMAENAGNGSEGRPFWNGGGVAGDVSSQGR